MRFLALTICLIIFNGCLKDPISTEQVTKMRLSKEIILLKKQVITRDTIVDLPLLLEAEILKKSNSWWMTDIDTIEFTSDSFAAFIFNSNDSLKIKKDVINSSNYYTIKNNTVFFKGAHIGMYCKGNRDSLYFTLDYTISYDSTGVIVGNGTMLEIDYELEQENLKNFSHRNKVVLYRIKYNFLPNTINLNNT